MLVVDIVKFIKPNKLSLPPKKLGTIANAPPEDWYCKEFYRASDKILQGGVLWSPEYGNGRIKQGGSLDFYLAAKKWGLEFIREGDRIRSHYKRFQPGGNYHKWISDGHLLAWVLIDFRTTIPTVPHPGKFFNSESSKLSLFYRIPWPLLRLLRSKFYHRPDFRSHPERSRSRISTIQRMKVASSWYQLAQHAAPMC